MGLAEHVRQLVRLALDEGRSEDARRASASEACAAMLGSTLAN